MNADNTNTVANTQPEGNGAQSEKTFTQEEVNKIVSDRLARDKAKSDATALEMQKEIEKKENAVECKAYIYDNDLPKELLDVIDTSDKEKFIKNVEKIKPLLKTGKAAENVGIRFGADSSAASEHRHDALADAFNLNRN